MKHAANVIIIGGGVIGCSIAYHLSKQGSSVIVLERGEIGGEASGAAAGLFSLLKPHTKIDAYYHLLQASMARFPDLVAELEAATGIAIEYEQTGTLRTIHHAQRIARLQSWLVACQAAGLQVQLLTEEETRKREPLLCSDLFGSLFFPAEGQVRASRVVEALSSAASARGVQFYTHTEVVGLRQHENRVAGVLTAQGEVFDCGQLVIATGAWAGRCGEWLNVSLPVKPQRGQILSLRQPVPPIRHIIIGKGVYVAPKQDNTVMVGATREDVGFDTSITAGGIHSLLTAAITLVPALAQCELLRMWAGLRPKTPDSYPIIGMLPGWTNAYLATGHYSFGILLGAITGHAISELMTTGQTPEIIRPFSLERFHL